MLETQQSALSPPPNPQAMLEPAGVRVEGVKKALALIRKTKDGVVSEGMCPKTFFLGLSLDGRRRGSVRTPKLTTRDAGADNGQTVPTAFPAPQIMS